MKQLWINCTREQLQQPRYSWTEKSDLFMPSDVNFPFFCPRRYITT